MQAKSLAKSDTSDWKQGYVSEAITADILNKSFTDYNNIATRA